MAHGPVQMPMVDDEEVRRVVKAEWGSKRTCPHCGTRFYDMMRSPIICPKCQQLVEPEVALRPRRQPVAVAEPKVVPPPEPGLVEAEVEGEELEVAEDEEKVAAEGTEGAEDEAALIEDASDLGEDDDDMAEVMEHLDEDLEDEV